MGLYKCDIVGHEQNRFFEHAPDVGRYCNNGKRIATVRTDM